MKDFDGARRYIRQIRNVRKQAYAAQLFGFLTGENTSAPSEEGLSLMGAQAVRMRLRELGF